MEYKLKKEDSECQLIKVRFKMSRSPIAVQLTKHISNLLYTYPEDRADSLNEFKRCLSNDGVWSLNFRVSQIIEHYGVKACRKWFEDVYGWEFNKEVCK